MSISLLQWWLECVQEIRVVPLISLFVCVILMCVLSYRIAEGENDLWSRVVAFPHPHSNSQALNVIVCHSSRCSSFFSFWDSFWQKRSVTETNTHSVPSFHINMYNCVSCSPIEAKVEFFFVVNDKIDACCNRCTHELLPCHRATHFLPAPAPLTGEVSPSQASCLSRVSLPHCDTAGLTGAPFTPGKGEAVWGNGSLTVTAVWLLEREATTARTQSIVSVHDAPALWTTNTKPLWLTNVFVECSSLTDVFNDRWICYVRISQYCNVIFWYLVL